MIRAFLYTVKDGIYLIKTFTRCLRCVRLRRSRKSRVILARRRTVPDYESEGFVP
jgi:hypothetical protein